MRFFILLFLGALAMTNVSNTANASDTAKSNEARPEFSDSLDGNIQTKLINGKYQNSAISYQTGLSDVFSMIKSFIVTKREAPVPVSSVPVKELSSNQLAEIEEDIIVRLGHSTILLKLDGNYVLIDPVFSERASPVQWAGPKRFHQAPISIEDLPNIDVVIISHDHYDHLDKSAIGALHDKVGRFIVPLGVDNYLKEWGVSSTKVTALAWWQSKNINGIEFTATPAQHFSGRGLFDRDESLWASWVIKSQDSNLFFSGDSGYFDGFKAIGNAFGPFDITLMETGAYNDMWSEIHMHPSESLQAHIDLQGRYMMPIHNGTFDLALHDWHEPFELITAYAKDKKAKLLTPYFGEILHVKSPKTTKPWWKEPAQAQALTLVTQ